MATTNPSDAEAAEPTSVPMRRRTNSLGDDPQAGSRRPNLFTLAHSRSHSKDGLSYVKEHHHPMSWSHLFKPPVVRQWLAGSVLVREEAEREASRFELFFDLVFVGIIHQLSESATEEAVSSWGIFKFVVFFYLSWSVWQDTRSFINTSGTDDIPQRAYVLVIMCLLLEFSSNAAAVGIECVEKTAESEVVRRAAEVAGKSHFGEATILPGGCELTPGWEKSVRGATAFYLVAKLVRIAVLCIYGYFLPRFRRAHLLRALSIALGCMFYIPLAFVEEPIDYLVLPVIAIARELVSSFSLALSLKLLHAMHLDRGRQKQKSDGSRVLLQHYTPALNLEHTIERTALFNVLVLGEMIINVTFTAVGSQSGIHTEYLRCILGLFIAYFLNWICADMDGCRTFLHALRRNWVTSISWFHLHFPLCASLILTSAAMVELVTEEFPHQRIRWLFGGGLATTMFCLAAIGYLHKNLDERSSCILHRNWRLSGRLAAAVIFGTLPLAELSSAQILGIHAAILFFTVTVETFGKIGAIGSEEKIKRALSSRTGHRDSEMPALHHEDIEVGEEHEFGLTPAERGEEDVGVEGDLGEIRVTKLGAEQRLAYAF